MRGLSIPATLCDDGGMFFKKSKQPPAPYARTTVYRPEWFVGNPGQLGDLCVAWDEGGKTAPEDTGFVGLRWTSPASKVVQLDYPLSEEALDLLISTLKEARKAAYPQAHAERKLRKAQRPPDVPGACPTCHYPICMCRWQRKYPTNTTFSTYDSGHTFWHRDAKAFFTYPPEPPHEKYNCSATPYLGLVCAECGFKAQGIAGWKRTLDHSTHPPTENWEIIKYEL